jgi:hypothetical protein
MKKSIGETVRCALMPPQPAHRINMATGASIRRANLGFNFTGL